MSEGCVAPKFRAICNRLSCRSIAMIIAAPTKRAGHHGAEPNCAGSEYRESIAGLDAKGVDYSARSGLNSASERTEQFQRDFLGDLMAFSFVASDQVAKEDWPKK
jgi:hypothetical protein